MGMFNPMQSTMPQGWQQQQSTQPQGMPFSMFANGTNGMSFAPQQQQSWMTPQQPMQRPQQAQPQQAIDYNSIPNNTWSMGQVQDWNQGHGRYGGVDYYQLPSIDALRQQNVSTTPQQYAQPAQRPQQGGLSSLGTPPPTVQMGANPIAQRNNAYDAQRGYFGAL
jgi:hypothetical protein